MISALLLLASLPASAQPQVSTAPAMAVSTQAARGPALRLLSESEYPDFSETFKSKAGLVKAAKKTLAYLTGPDYAGPRLFRLADREYAQGILADSVEELLATIKEAKTPEEFASLVKERFDVYQSNGSDGNGRVVFSSYYQPVLAASKQRSEKYRYPIYRRPSDMVEVQPSVFDPKLGAQTYVGRLDKKSGRVLPYFSRSDIDIKKKLAGKGLELAWLKDKFDVLDLHIQGSGILKFPSGHELLAKYAGTNNLPYNSVGILLVKARVIDGDITHDKVRQYFHDHPEAEDWLLAQDPRYTFFDLAPLPPDGEPYGSVQQSLVPARSIAIDPSLVPLGTIAYFTTTSPQADEKGRLLGLFPNSRFALCMDTGGAIKGPGRVDIYAGHGPQADTTARNQWAEGKLYFLIKKIPPRER